MPYGEVGPWAFADLSISGVARARLGGQDSDLAFSCGHSLPGRGGRDGPLSALGEGLCLELFELGRGDRALVEQSLSCGDLFRSIAAGPCNVFYVGLGRGLCAPEDSGVPLSHPPASDDEVDQRGEKWDEHQGDDPQSLHPSIEVPIAEEVTDDLEQDHQEVDEEEAPDQEPEEIPERVHRAASALSVVSDRAVACRHTASSWRQNR